MGRKGSGVEVRDTSIRVSFVLVKGERPIKRTLVDENGVPLRPTIPNIKFAQRLNDEIKRKIDLGVFAMRDYFPNDEDVAGETLAAHLDAWYDTLRLEQSTLAGYKAAVRFWKEARHSTKDPEARLGDRALQILSLTDCKTALALRSDLSGKTVNNYVSVLREALELAVIDGHLQRNIAEEIPRAKWQRDPPDPFSRDEAEAIIAYAAKHYPEPVYNLIETWFFSGPRTSEIFGLKWSNVDLATEHVLIAEALVRGVEKSTTKTGVARSVMLNSRSLAAIQRQRKHTQMKGEYVFVDPRYDLPWTEERAFRRSYWEPCLKVLGIRYRRPYNMRHAFATMMLMARRTPAWCAKQLGHSVEVFHRTYSKWIDGEQNHRELAGLEAWLNAGDTRSKETAT